MVNSLEIFGTLCTSLDELSQKKRSRYKLFRLRKSLYKKSGIRVYLHQKNEIGKRKSRQVWIINFCQQLWVLRHGRRYLIVFRFVYNS